ncbi:hypothetical protein [Mucilaginibacter psychrotolerans]|uniref:Uncharacterized protein n=1 Tax=Mucilaginibacter psychrotolerans TaxID=1524096 RepID=A0A4Y8S5Z5_9SPHI|nr:hypothetical protein [Mucilaginibacter psychrotolerans]TFF34025.1 hypothetical protein E2R66_23310 [Mucilaginibacter psychrotolerans]
MNDPDSYSGVSFTTLKPSYESYENSGTSEYKRLKAKLSNADSVMMHYSFIADDLEPFGPEKEYKAARKTEAYWKKKKDSIIVVIDRNAENYHGKLTGYELNHSFRAKNSFGAVMLKNATFYYNETLSEVLFATGID